MTGGFLALSTFALLTVACLGRDVQVATCSELVEGARLIFVQDGKLNEKNFRSERRNIDDVAKQRRGEGIDASTRSKWVCKRGRAAHEVHQGGVVASIRPWRASAKRAPMTVEAENH